MLSFACDPVTRVRVACNPYEGRHGDHRDHDELLRVALQVFRGPPDHSVPAENLQIRTTEADESSSALSATRAVAGLPAMSASTKPDAPATPSSQSSHRRGERHGG